MATTADAFSRDAVTVPAITPLDTWEVLEPLALSSHVLLDRKTVPVKSHFRIVVFAYATVDKQNLRASTGFLCFSQREKIQEGGLLPTIAWQKLIDMNHHNECNIAHKYIFLQAQGC